MQGPPPSGPYPSYLLNEIHAHFPALLYNPDQFQTVPQLLGYVHQQMRHQFDLYSSWRSHYHRTVLQNPLMSNRDPWAPAPATPQASTPSTPPMRRRPSQRRRPAATTTTAPYVVHVEQTPILPRASNPTVVPNTHSAGSAELLDILAQTFLADPVLQPLINVPSGPPVTFRTPFSNITYRAPTLPANFLDPVPIVPTAEQLQLGSIVYPTATALDAPCAICQDAIQAGDTVRKLLGCNHVFHRACVDVWFQRNVNCPVCRHDIRIRTSATRSPGVPSAAPPAGVPPPQAI